jgi:hypothetical protein
VFVVFQWKKKKSVFHFSFFEMLGLFLVMMATIVKACDGCSCCSSYCSPLCTPVLGKPVFVCGRDSFPVGCICTECVPNVANIVGIVVGILVLVIGACVACCYFCCRRHETKQIIFVGPAGGPSVESYQKLPES